MTNVLRFPKIGTDEDREAVLNRTAQLLTRESRNKERWRKEIREALNDMAFPAILELRAILESELRGRWRYVRITDERASDPVVMEREDPFFHLCMYRLDHES